MNNLITDFARRHRLLASDIDINSLVNLFIREMIKGLEGKESSLHMIPTFFEADNKFLTDVPVVAIDAGGTNLRAALVSFSGKGELQLGEILNYRMPGLDREVSADEFFETIAAYIKPLTAKAERIGFCFSYATEILPNRDGKLLHFCKEVQAPGVVGKLIGKTLLETLGTPDKKIVLLNDTVTTLLAGKSAAYGEETDSFIGFILGTGSNTAYIEQNSNILKNRNIDRERSQIINIESGSFGLAPRGDIDIRFNNSTSDPAKYTFEKMFSGGYFGGLCLEVLKQAAAEGLFSPDSGKKINNTVDLTTWETNSFAESPYSGDSPLHRWFVNNGERKVCFSIIDILIDRAAKLVAANLAAVVIKTGKGREESKPVLITVEGTTFYKLHNFKERFEKYLLDYLSGERKRHVMFTEVSKSSLIGAALAALID